MGTVVVGSGVKGICVVVDGMTSVVVVGFKVMGTGVDDS